MVPVSMTYQVSLSLVQTLKKFLGGIHRRRGRKGRGKDKRRRKEGDCINIHKVIG
jgi:hypothetical protein